MKCLKCGKSIKDDSIICPYCGGINKVKNKTNKSSKSKKSVDLDLPMLKEEVKEVTPKEIVEAKTLYEDAPIQVEEDLEPTRTIKVIDGDDSLVNDINEQINKMNEESKAVQTIDLDDIVIPTTIEPEKKEDELSKSKVVEDEKITDNELDDTSKEETTKNKKALLSIETTESVKSRKKVLLITAITFVILLTVACVSIKLMASHDSSVPVDEDYMTKLEKSLQNYYDTEKIDDIIYVLEDNKNNEEALNNIHNKVKEKCEEWLNIYIDTEFATKEEFDELTKKYKNIYNGLYEYAVVKKDDNYIRALSDFDRNSYIMEVDNAYDDSRVFYEALELYNANDYDKAYYIFNQIEQANTYYNKAKKYCSTIIDNVLTLLEADINKIEKGIDDLSVSDKLKRYSQIEQVIMEYNRIYENLELNNQERYSNLLDTYRNKVTEYTYALSKENETDVTEG